MNDNLPERIAHNAKLLPQLNAAIAAGDFQAAERLLRKSQPAAGLLLVLKESFGAESVEGLDTREAERVFGADWKERDFHELVSKLHA
jgi:hypothetical protein